MKPYRRPPRPEIALVTGGAGFIGTHLCRALKNAGHEVYSLDLKESPPSPVDGVHYITGDVRQYGPLREILENHAISVVYHLAATVSVPLCQRNAPESYSNNVMATLTLLEACRHSSQPIRFAFASSAALYGTLGDHRKPLVEEEIASRFQSFYAAQKHASEKMIELYHAYHQIPSLIFRFFNVFGEGQDPDSPYSGVITIFTREAQAHRPLKLFHGGIQTRDFIPVTEVASALTSALTLPSHQWDAQVLNLGSGTSTSIRALAEVVRSASRAKVPLVDAPPREGDVLHSLADIGRARRLLGFEPSADLSEELQRLVRQDDSNVLGSPSSERYTSRKRPNQAVSEKWEVTRL